MSSTDNTDDLTIEQIDRKLEHAAAALPDSRVEALQQKRAELTGEADPDDSPGFDVDAATVEEALAEFDREALRDADALEEAIEHRQQKLTLAGRALRDSRVDEVREEIEALRAALDAHSEYRINTADRLADRAEVDG